MEMDVCGRVYFDLILYYLSRPFINQITGKFYCEQLETMQDFHFLSYEEAPQQPAPRLRSTQVLDELLLIQQQTDLLAEIARNLDSTKKANTLSTEISNLSSSSINCSQVLNGSFLQMDLNSSFLSSHGSSDLHYALREVRSNCSASTYSLIRKALQQGGDGGNPELYKQKRHNEELVRKCLQLTREVTDLKAQLQTVQQASAKLQAKTQAPAVEKRAEFLKWEKAMLYKQKAQAEIKKSLNRYFTMVEQEREQNQSVKNEIQSLLSGLASSTTQKMQEVVSSCIQVLNEQRAQMNSLYESHLAAYAEVDRAVGDLRKQCGQAP